MATRNRQQMLDRAIASVLAQTWADWELVVIDNSDQRQRVSDDPRIRLYRVAPSNIPHLYNQALEKTRGEIIGTLSDDDTLDPGALATVADAIGDSDWLVAATEIRDEAGNPMLYRGGTRESVEQTRRGQYMLGGAVYWRKALSDLLGGYDESYDGAGDFECYLRFLRHSEPKVIADILYYYTDWEGTDSRVRAANQADQSARIASL